jgi:SAM-dependent methyltransferase
MNPTITESTTPDLTQVNREQLWASGGFYAMAILTRPIADALCDAVDLQAGWRVVDVGRDSGNAAIAAARRGCDVVGIDYSPAVRGRDAGEIPFPDGSFDAVLSVFGSMFAPDHRHVAAELTRVCRHGGRIGLATWTPDGFIGEMLKVVAAHVPPEPGVASPLLWGSEPYVSKLFGNEIDTLACTERTLTLRFLSAEASVSYFRTFYGPTVRAFESVGTEGADALFADLADLARRHADTSAGPVAIPATWLETIAIRNTKGA